MFLNKPRKRQQNSQGSSQWLTNHFRVGFVHAMLFLLLGLLWFVFYVLPLLLLFLSSLLLLCDHLLFLTYYNYLNLFIGKCFSFYLFFFHLNHHLLQQSSADGLNKLLESKSELKVNLGVLKITFQCDHELQLGRLKKFLSLLF